MEFVIENQYLTVKVKDVGAEIISVTAKETGIEYIWQGDEKVWNRHAPILFPIVGRLKEDTYHYKGAPYHLTQHGFARDSKFHVHERLSDSITFILQPNERFLSVYPFLFGLQITYRLFKNELVVTYKVKNLDEKTMFFSIGGHPGFNVPLAGETVFTDYAITIEPAIERERIFLQGPFVAAEDSKWVNQNHIPLEHGLFADDAIIFKTGQPMTLTLASTKDSHGVKMTVKNFDYVGIWTKNQSDATYICIEPWCGLADFTNSDGDIEHKQAIHSLDAGEKFTAEHKIEFF